MKSIEERARELLYAIKYTAITEESTARIIEALKEEQKITRHACADKSMMIPKDYDKKSAEWTNGFIDATKMIHAAIMNVNTEKE